MSWSAPVAGVAATSPGLNTSTINSQSTHRIYLSMQVVRLQIPLIKSIFALMLVLKHHWIYTLFYSLYLISKGVELIFDGQPNCLNLVSYNFCDTWWNWAQIGSIGWGVMGTQSYFFQVCVRYVGWLLNIHLCKIDNWGVQSITGFVTQWYFISNMAGYLITSLKYS